MLKKFFLTLIKFYRLAISPLFPSSCRFHPTCSQYAIDAINKYGAVRGMLKAGLRILKCHPLHPGGYDPA
ncbi:MAG TPA: membrane protein insertion efficiency factor YidD [Desulfomonilia bacterium]